MKQYISIDIGGTMIKYGLINENGNITETNETETEAYLGGQHILQKITKICEEYIIKNNILGICISTAGMVDSKEGKIIYANKSIPNYIGINYKKTFENLFNIPCEVENDVNCAGICESYIGAGKGTHSCLCLTIGTGIGGCAIIEGKVLGGFSSSGCEVGYMNMFGSTFQELASNTTLVENVSERLGINYKDINGKIIFERAKNGDKVCIEEIDKLCDYLAYGIANICYIINPEIVILGGGIMAQKEYLNNRILNNLKKYLIEPLFNNTKISFAQYKNQAGMLGAYYNFLSKQK